MLGSSKERFSDQNIPLASGNPNPVLIVTIDGLLVYSNEASKNLLESLPLTNSVHFPANWILLIKAACEAGKVCNSEIEVGNEKYYINILPQDSKETVHIYCQNISSWSNSSVIKQVEIISSNPDTANQKLLVKVLAEIRERKKNELRLQESEARFKRLVEAGQDFIYSTDFQGNFTYINPVGLKKIGYTEAEIIGKNFSLLVRDDWKLNVASFYKDKFTNKIKDSYLEFPVISKQGEEWWVGQNVLLILEDNYIIGTQAYARDITERRKAEEDLKIQQAFHNNILDNLPINIFLKDKLGKYLFVNKHALTKTKINPLDIIGKDAFEFYPQEFATTISRTDKETWENKSFYSEEKVQSEEGEMHLMLGKKIISIDELKEPVLLGYTVDITERIKVEQELIKEKQRAEESTLAKEKFISIMSHEIRTPMNAVVGITNLLLQQIQNPEQKEYYNGLKISSENLLNILNSVLDLSKIESGKVTFEEIDFSPLDIIVQVKDLFKFKAAEKNLILESKIDPKIPEYLKGDPHRLNQILVNLFSNAIKFTNEGKVSCEIELLDENDHRCHLLFSVIDTGTGIPEDKLRSIFDSFTQADSDITRKYGGTGLGLTITKRLIELQGGGIDVESRLNKGSKFSFDLKLFKSRRKKLDIKVVGKDYHELAGLRVLVVEDNKMNQLVVTKFLDREKIISEVADNGRYALELIRKRNFDLILMDLQMPVMDGFETTSYIRNELKLNIPIIAFTASSSVNIENKVYECGMNDYLIKPFDPSVFYSIIAKYTNRQITTEESTIIPTMNSMIDLSYLKDASGGNHAFMKDMIDIFLKQTPGYLAQLNDYCKDANWVEFRKVMHKLKPTITMMGIKEGDALVKEIEPKVKKSEELDTVPNLLSNLIRVCETAYDELQKEVLNLN
jgi:PAS domain S-box-containing protein